jgi:hypothetical protein
MVFGLSGVKTNTNGIPDFDLDYKKATYRYTKSTLAPRRLCKKIADKAFSEYDANLTEERHN